MRYLLGCYFLEVTLAAGFYQLIDNLEQKPARSPIDKGFRANFSTFNALLKTLRVVNALQALTDMRFASIVLMKKPLRIKAKVAELTFPAPTSFH